jgi:hypothetical protein
MPSVSHQLPDPEIGAPSAADWVPLLGPARFAPARSGAEGGAVKRSPALMGLRGERGVRALEPPAPSAEEARPFVPIADVPPISGHRAAVLHAAAAGSSDEGALNPKIRGARRGPVFTAAAGRTRGTSRPLDRIARKRVGSGARVEIELEGGAPHLSPSPHRALQRERATGVEECLGRTSLRRRRSKVRRSRTCKPSLSKKSTREIQSTPASKPTWVGDSLHGALPASAASFAPPPAFSAGNVADQVASDAPGSAGGAVSCDERRCSTPNRFDPERA